MLTHIKDGKNFWTVVVKNKAYQFDPSNQRYDDLVKCVSDGNEQDFINLIDTGRVVTSFTEGHFKVENGVLTYKGFEVDQVIAERILDMIEQKFDYKPMLRFVENLFSNPSMRACTELYKFLVHKHMPITSDGCFLAYKGLAVYEGEDSHDKIGRPLVKGDYVDKYTRNSYRNNVGDVNEMPRNAVDDNCQVGCSKGLHVGSLAYASDYACSGPLVICKINPADVVSVPTDCEFQKVRASKYEVVGVYSEPLTKAVDDQYDEDEDDTDYEDEDEEDQWRPHWAEDEDDDEDDEDEDYEDRFI